MTTSGEIRDRLDRVLYPGYRYSLVRYGLVGDVQVAKGGEVTVKLLPVSARKEVAEAIRSRVEAAVGELPGVISVRVVSAEVPGMGPPAAEISRKTPVPGVRAVIAVSSAKGGVGKSTVAVNLALALRDRGKRVALLDADVYGPSIPIMLGVEARPRPSGKKMSPIRRHGVALMSMGFFLDDRSPVIWRGPMVMGLIRQFLEDVEWGDQDILVVDMPPGTGDAALTLAQLVEIDGAVIVTTPQEVALQDVERGIAMFRQLQVPVLGVVENMSYFECPDCGEREEIFGAGGADRLADTFGIDVLERLPLLPRLREAGDAGRPLLVSAPEDSAVAPFRRLAGLVDAAIGKG